MFGSQVCHMKQSVTSVIKNAASENASELSLQAAGRHRHACLPLVDHFQHVWETLCSSAQLELRLFLQQT